MFTLARTVASMWLAQWRALREDEGASTIEYILLVVLGIAAAALVTTAVTKAVKSHDKDIQ